MSPLPWYLYDGDPIPSIGVTIIKIRWSHDRVIFVMGIPLCRKTVLISKSVPGVPGLYRKSSDTANNTATWALKDEATDMSVGRWAAGQPDITKGTCVAVDLSADSHLWSFIPCNEKLPFVCQIPALPPGIAVTHWLLTSLSSSGAYMRQ